MLPEQEFQALRTLHFALIMGCVGFLAVAAYVGPLTAEGELPVTASYVAGIASMSLLAPAFILFRQRLRQRIIAPFTPEGQAALRAALILHWALIEMPCMSNIVLFLLTGSVGHAALAVGGLLVLAFRAPSMDRILRWTTRA